MLNDSSLRCISFPWMPTWLNPVFPLKSILPLRPHRQHKHGVDSRHIVVQRHITTLDAADDQFAFAVFHWPPNLGAVGQNLDGFQNVANTLGRRSWVELGNVFKEAVEIVKDSPLAPTSPTTLPCASLAFLAAWRW